jgi:transposase InsO family protein
VAGQATASAASLPEPQSNLVAAPCTHLQIEVLRRPVEFTQYLAIRSTDRLADAGAVTSVGSKGDSFDNALAESTIGLDKTELIRRRGPWRGLDDVELATLAWVDWYNHRRLHGACDNIPPAEYEAAYTPETPAPEPSSV